LDNTLLLWTNELGKGNSHTHDDIPFVLVGNGLDFKMGRSLKYQKVPHNRLLLSLAHGLRALDRQVRQPELLRPGTAVGADVMVRASAVAACGFARRNAKSVSEEKSRTHREPAA
jgi:hypothetical protein